MIKSMQMQKTNKPIASDYTFTVICLILIALLYVISTLAPRHNSTITVEIVYISIAAIGILLMIYAGLIRRRLVLLGKGPMRSYLLTGSVSIILSIIYIGIAIGIFIHGWNLK